MADKKIEKALYGPSTTEVALGALLGFVLGVFVSIVYLVWKPVQRVPAIPKDAVANVVYFVPGNENSVRARAWQAKMKTLAAGGEASFSEEELNAFAATLDPAIAEDKPSDKDKKPAPAKPAKPGEAAKPADAKPNGEFFTANGVNFRILKNDKLQISLKCGINYYGIGTDAFVLATGSFMRSGNGYVFDADTFYFGSCPLHKLPVGEAFITARILNALKLPDNVRTWDKITSIRIEAGQLKITTSS
ncbi:MAG TPA: hypothetical protein VHD32_17665 [Candidatus Didemnitutus sp.]|nr:hypothetical protein [Candidatus Didemnitutus sp.]